LILALSTAKEHARFSLLSAACCPFDYLAMRKYKSHPTTTTMRRLRGSLERTKEDIKKKERRITHRRHRYSVSNAIERTERLLSFLLSFLRDPFRLAHRQINLTRKLHTRIQKQNSTKPSFVRARKLLLSREKTTTTTTTTEERKLFLML
jgi:hypothetical protein